MLECEFLAGWLHVVRINVNLYFRKCMKCEDIYMLLWFGMF